VRPHGGVQFADSRQGALWASRKTVLVNNRWWNSKSVTSAPEALS